MSIVATNVALRSYGNGSLNRDWNAGANYQLGYNNNINYNYVVVIRFTLDKHAKSVSIPIVADGTNSTSSTKTLSYELGPNPEMDTSKTNIVASNNALGSFYFTSNIATSTITLGHLSAGTYYLYIYASSDSQYTAETSMSKSGTINSITYEELKCVIYIDNGTSFDMYEIWIDNGSSWDQYAPYIDNGSGWDECG
jgi:hypothetical protein